MDHHALGFALLRDHHRSLPDNIIISDSEPESENGQRESTAGPSTSQAQSKGFSAAKSAIHTKKGTVKESSRCHPIPGIYELNDESDSEEVEVIEKHPALPSAPQLPRSTPPGGSAVSTRNELPLEVPAPSKDGLGSNQIPFDLSQFAYPTQPNQAKSRVTTVQSSVHSTRSTPPLKRPIARKIHSATDFLTDSEIDRLTRCVACDRAWTTKKTAAKKREHLRACQKKNALTDETVVLLIERELAKPVEEDAGRKGKGKAKENVSPKKPVTLLNDLVHDAYPKKRGKKREMPSTIIGIQHQHETMQENSKRLFSLVLEEEEDSTPGLSAATSTTFPLTQEFPVSKLGNAKGFVADPETGLPSPVQSGDEEDPISISSGSESRASGGSFLLSLHKNGRLQPLPSAPRQSAASFSGGDEWMEELQREIDNRERTAQWKDAEMQDTGDMGVGVGNAFEDTDGGVYDLLRGVLSDTRGKNRRPPGSTPRKNPIASHSQARGHPLPNSLTSVAQRQEDFDSIMQERITSDENLWLRVLRYEPVNFTEFLNIAIAAGVPSEKVTDRLRTFLISRAIHFSTPRERKRR